MMGNHVAQAAVRTRDVFGPTDDDVDHLEIDDVEEPAELAGKLVSGVSDDDPDETTGAAICDVCDDGQAVTSRPHPDDPEHTANVCRPCADLLDLVDPVFLARLGTLVWEHQEQAEGAGMDALTSATDLVEHDIGTPEFRFAWRTGYEAIVRVGQHSPELVTEINNRRERKINGWSP